MKSKNLPVLAMIALASVFIVACGEQDKGPNKREFCGMIMEQGGQDCSPVYGAQYAKTATSTTPTTVTQTETKIISNTETE